MFKKKLEKPYVAAIVPAAGLATRMNGLDKQLEEIEEVPVIIHTLHALSYSDWIDEMVVVVRPDMVADIHALIKAYAVPKVRSVVTGGDSRQQSVERGIEAMSPQTAYIAIHDGARPLVSQTVIAQTMLDAMRYQAAAAAVPVADTIKIADQDKKITSTPDRKNVYAVQTPQAFEAGRYRQALSLAKEQNKDYTDDCQLMEAAGFPVYLSTGDYDNFKITTPVDLLLAQSLVRCREEGLI